MAKFDGSEWIIYNTDNSELPYDGVSHILFDDNNRVWIGTPEGLAVIEDTTWIVYNHEQFGLPGDAVPDISFDGKGNTWIAIYPGGFAKYDDTEWISYNLNDYDVVNAGLQKSLIFDRTNNLLWLGLSRVGLVSFKENQSH